MNNKPLVSILMNCYNGERYLQEAIYSILCQTYHNWELIFWDNQSTDKSAEIFQKNKDPRLRYFLSPKHTTLGEARRMASKEIRGDWLGIIDADDKWGVDKLTKQISAMNKSNLSSEPIGLVYSRAMGIDDNSQITKEVCHRDYLGLPMPEGRILKDLLIRGNFIPSPTILVNTKLFFSVGGFPKDIHTASDYYISCAISSKANIICVDEFLTHYRIHDQNNTKIEKVISYEEQLKIFNVWSKFIDISPAEKIIRIKQLHSFIGLMMIMYNNQLVKGFKRVIKNGSIWFSIKSMSEYLVNKLKSQ